MVHSIVIVHPATLEMVSLAQILMNALMVQTTAVLLPLALILMAPIIAIVLKAILAMDGAVRMLMNAALKLIIALL